MLPHAIRFADTPFPSLLRHGKQGIKVSLLFHQFVKGSGFGNTAVLQNQYPVIPAQKRFLQSVSHNDAVDRYINIFPHSAIPNPFPGMKKEPE